ncbi:MAG: hypothetical protein CME20_04540 [Gemmatimonadetes bacterium]|nr:hypothetical protein [Gemmatimonadota bacterium]
MLRYLNTGEWCDRNGIALEKLYGVELHPRGATLPDLGLSPLLPTDLACLSQDAIGDPQYTIEGWLDRID